MKIRCYTLYDITKTGVNFRNRFNSKFTVDDLKHRNQQSNYETILQIVSMRSQPEEIKDTEIITINISEIGQYNFGYLFTKKYLKNVRKLSIWTFEFEIDRMDVFNNGISELGYLLLDCENVPMIIKLDESVKLSEKLDTTDENRNIYFVKTSDAQS